MRAIAEPRFRPLPRIRVLLVLAPLLSLLLPAVAAAEWGNESWGQMVWGGSTLANIPSVPPAGVAALAGLLLVLAYWILTSRRMRAKNPSLHS